MNQTIRTAVFPVAGLGTRFLPVTKAGPKEMLPIVDRPLIQYVVEEALAVGITQLIFVTSSAKRAIEDYFDSNYELESRLIQKGKTNALQRLKAIHPHHVSIVYVRQPEPLGLGDAVLRAKSVIGDSPFVVLLADDVMEKGHHACLEQMIAIYQKTQASVVAVEKVSPKDTDKYGIVELAEDLNDGNRITSIIEKPDPRQAVSNLAVTGRYLFNSKIFSLLEKTPRGIDGEIQLTDAIAALLKEESVMACPIQGRRYDCGSQLGCIKATLDFALKRPELKQQLLTHLESVLEREEA